MAAESVNILAAVSSLIAAFTSVHDILDRAYGRYAPRKASAVKTRDTERLRRSLQSAPRAIEREYVRGRKVHSQEFERGDVEAQAALTATLLKVNASLVSIVSDFLQAPPAITTNVSRSRHGLQYRPLDLRNLAAFAKVCRIEACKALRSLRRRLAGRSKPTTKSHVSQEPTSHLKRETKPTATPVQEKKTHWAVIRPRARPVVQRWPVERQKHSTSQKPKRSKSPRAKPSAGSVPSTASSTLIGSSSRTLPLHEQRHKQNPKKQQPKPKARGVPSTEPHVAPAINSTDALAARRKAINDLEISSSSPERTMARTHPLDNTYQHSTPFLPPLTAAPQARYPPARCYVQERPDTIHTFLTDSTKIGEIPVRHSVREQELEELAKLNAATGFGAGAGNAGRNGNWKGKRKGLFAKVFRGMPVAST